AVVDRLPAAPQQQDGPAEENDPSHEEEFRWVLRAYGKEPGWASWGPELPGAALSGAALSRPGNGGGVNPAILLRCRRQGQRPGTCAPDRDSWGRRQAPTWRKSPYRQAVTTAHPDPPTAQANHPPCPLGWSFPAVTTLNPSCQVGNFELSGRV